VKILELSNRKIKFFHRFDWLNLNFIKKVSIQKTLFTLQDKILNDKIFKILCSSNLWKFSGGALAPAAHGSPGNHRCHQLLGEHDIRGSDPRPCETIRRGLWQWTRVSPLPHRSEPVHLQNGLQPSGSPPRGQTPLYYSVRGLKLKQEQPLPGIPTAIESLYIDETEPKTPGMRKHCYKEM